MPLLPPDASPDPVLRRALWQWLILDCAVLLLVPAARGPVQWLGNLPFWLLAAPALSLLILHRHALVAAWRARLVRATPRRRQLSRSSASANRGQASSSRRPAGQQGTRRIAAR